MRVIGYSSYHQRSAFYCSANCFGNGTTHLYNTYGNYSCERANGSQFRIQCKRNDLPNQYKLLRSCARGVQRNGEKYQQRMCVNSYSSYYQCATTSNNSSIFTNQSHLLWNSTHSSHYFTKWHNRYMVSQF